MVEAKNITLQAAGQSATSIDFSLWSPPGPPISELLAGLSVPKIRVGGIVWTPYDSLDLDASNGGSYIFIGPPGGEWPPKLRNFCRFLAITSPKPEVGTKPYSESSSTTSVTLEIYITGPGSVLVTGLGGRLNHSAIQTDGRSQKYHTTGSRPISDEY